MSRTHLMTVAALAAITALAFMASATSAGTVQSQRASAAATGITQIGAVSVRLRINQFVRRGGHLYAVGTTTANLLRRSPAPPRIRPRSLRSSRPPRQVDSRVLVRAEDLPDPRSDAWAARPEPARPDRAPRPVHLTITADSRGACSAALVRARQHGRQPAKAVKLTKAAHRSGLSTRGLRHGRALFAPTSGNGATGRGTVSPLFICPILDLTLGPLDLNLLGLMVHLDTVHLVITADSEGGLLGQLLAGLLCSGGGGAPAGAR